MSRNGGIAKPFRDAEIFDRLRDLLGVRFVYEEATPRRTPPGSP